MNIDDLKAELEQIKDEKYKLLKLVNHDIRSPFNRIFALMQLFEMEMDNVTSQQKEYIDAMYLSILSGLEMITNLRDMREIDANNIEIEKSEFDLINTLQKAIRAFSKQIDIKKLILKTELEVENAPIYTDEYFVQRSIENVLSNAIKFSREGKKIFIRLTKDNIAYKVEIQDYGDGIKPEEESLLYQKFMKLSSIATGGEGSLGLGLHNTSYFINRLHGSLKLERNNLAGSLFILTFPEK